MCNSFGGYLVIAGLFSLIGCAPVESDARSESAPAELMPSSASSRVMTHNVIFFVSPESTLDEVDAELEAGADWFVLEEQGLIDIVEAWDEEIVISDGSSSGPSAQKVVDSGSSGDVSAGAIFYKVFSASPGYTYTISITAYQTSTGSLISDGYARADLWRVKGSTTEWRDSSAVNSGKMKVSTSCGASCTGVRLKIANNATVNGHTYVYSVDRT